MKKLIFVLIVVVLIFGCKKKDAKNEAPKANFKTLTEKVSYAIGTQIGKNFKSQGLELDLKLVKAGMEDAVKDKPLKLTEDQMMKAMQDYQQEMTKKMQIKQQNDSAKNLREGEAYLSQNKAKPGVVTTSTGLQYKIIKEGNGPTPKQTDVVECNYKGTFIDGKEFDSSAKHGGPASFPVNQVIPGWTEALLKMKVGSKWQLVVPAKLAYGEQGAGQEIGPNAVLLFDIELISIKKGK